MAGRPNYSAYLKAVSPEGNVHNLLSMIGEESRLERASTESSADLAGAVEAARRGNEMTDAQIYAVEALIYPEIRPVIDVVNDSYEHVTHPVWPILNKSKVKAHVERAIRASGRIELKTGSQRYGGTGFVVGDGLLMTNRHVAELFARGLGDSYIVFKPGFDPGFDLKRERKSGAGVRLTVSRVRVIHPYWDCALLEVRGLPASVAKLLLSGEAAASLVGRSVALIGYPAEDPRNPEVEQDDVMDGVFRVKRLAPGLLSSPANVGSFGKLVMSLGHDASTLGGNSGSAVIDLDSGKVVGLHFGGAYKVRNNAVASADLAADPRMHDAGVNFEAARPASTPAWENWWARSFDGEALSPSVSGARLPASTAPPSAPQSEPILSAETDGSVTLTIPLQISVRLGAAETAPMMDIAADQDSTEAMVEPWRDTDYAGRGGYDRNFLGEGDQIVVPAPIAKDPSVIAPAKSGDTELRYENFSISMHGKRRLALFTASNVTGEPKLRRPDPRKTYTRKALSGLDKNDLEKWFTDDRLDPKFQVPDYFYSRDGGNFDKGHIVRRDDVAWGQTYDKLRRANGDTYHVTNCSPQIAIFNRSTLGEDNWGDFEDVVLSQAAGERLCVFAGPVLDDADPWFLGKAGPRKPMKLQVPSRFWKVVASRVEGGIAVYALLLEQDLSLMPQTEPQEGEEFVLPGAFEKSLVRLKDIEGWTGVLFDETLHKADQYFTERGIAAASIAGAKRQRRKKS